MAVFNGGTASTWTEQAWLSNSTADTGSNEGWWPQPARVEAAARGPAKGFRGHVSAKGPRAYREAQSEERPVFKRPVRARGFARRSKRYTRQ